MHLQKEFQKLFTIEKEYYHSLNSNDNFFSITLNPVRAVVDSETDNSYFSKINLLQPLNTFNIRIPKEVKKLEYALLKLKSGNYLKIINILNNKKDWSCLVTKFAAEFKQVLIYCGYDSFYEIGNDETMKLWNARSVKIFLLDKNKISEKQIDPFTIPEVLERKNNDIKLLEEKSFISYCNNMDKKEACLKLGKDNRFLLSKEVEYIVDDVYKNVHYFVEYFKRHGSPYLKEAIKHNGCVRQISGIKKIMYLW